MYLVQILLPVYGQSQQDLPEDVFNKTRKELTTRFGGVTAYVRSPAKGYWKDPEEHVSKDDIVIFEVMTERLDTSWWTDYRQTLEQRFDQEKIIIRSSQIEIL